MKVRVKKGLHVELNTLIRLERKGLYPKLILHERFEKKVKILLRIITILGIATSVISISTWFVSLSIAILIFLIEQFFERVIFEYTTLVIQPPPDFKLDFNEWKTNGFLIPDNNNPSNFRYIAPTFATKEYAIKFFKYMKSWNWGIDVDSDNNIILSFILEGNNTYTTYLYANMDRKNLNEIFEQEFKNKRLEKFGKQQQKFIMQMIYCKNLNYNNDYLISKFLNYHRKNDPYYLLPAIVPSQVGNQPEFLYDERILKYHYKFKKREQVTRDEIEYHFP